MLGWDGAGQIQRAGCTAGLVLPLGSTQHLCLCFSFPPFPSPFPTSLCILSLPPLSPSLANFIGTGPLSKYPQPCGPYHICCNYSAPRFKHIIHEWICMAVFQKSFIYKTDGRPQFASFYFGVTVQYSFLRFEVPWFFFSIRLISPLSLWHRVFIL